MASRKNRSGKANRRSPKSAQGLRDRLHRRFDAVVTWLAGHRWHAIVGGLLLLFAASLFGGYWLAERLELRDRDRLARDTLEEMKRGTPAEPAAKYARIEDIPGLPKYTDAEPGQPRPTLDEKPRAAKPQQLAAAANRNARRPGAATPCRSPTSTAGRWSRS